MLRVLICACAMVLPAQAAFAQNASDEAREALALEMVELSGAAALAQQGFTMMLPSLAPALREQYPDATPQQIDQALTLIGGAFEDATPQILNAAASHYAAAFTFEELEAITAFYRSEVGTKLIESQPQLTQQTAMSAQMIGAQTMQAIEPEVEAIFATD